MENNTPIRLERADYPEQVGVSSREIAEMLKDFKENNVEVHSIMILRHNKVAYETWASPYAPEFPHAMYSVSKSFTATAIGFAIEEGLLSLETKLIDIFPEFKPETEDKNLEKLNIHHLLSMQSGKNVSVFSNKGKNQWIKDFFDAPWGFEPGDGHWKYISENQYMLCAMLHRITGISVTEYLTPRLFQPLGIEVPFWEHDTEGVEAGGWGLYLKTEDLAKYILCYQHDGKFNGKQVIPKNWVYLSQKSHGENSPVNTNPDCQCGYGYCFWRCAHINGYRADGMFSQFGIVTNDGSDASFIITAGEINEQKTRDSIWRHFPKCLIEPDSEPTPEIKPELEPLDDNLNASKHNDIESELEGKIMSFRKNVVLEAAGFPLSMLPAPVVYMSGDRAGNINNIELSFTEDTCTMSWDEGDEHNTIVCGMDGNPRQSPITLAQIPFTAFSTAQWTAEKELSIHMRPVGAICLRKIRLVFDGDKVTLYPSSQQSTEALAQHFSSDIESLISTAFMQKFGLIAFDLLPNIIDAPLNGKIISK